MKRMCANARIYNAAHTIYVQYANRVRVQPCRQGVPWLAHCAVLLTYESSLLMIQVACACMPLRLRVVCWQQ